MTSTSIYYSWECMMRLYGRSEYMVLPTRKAEGPHKVYLNNISLFIFHNYKYLANIIEALCLAVVKKAAFSAAASAADKTFKAVFDCTCETVLLVIFEVLCSETIFPLYKLSILLIIHYIFICYFSKHLNYCLQIYDFISIPPKIFRIIFKIFTKNTLLCG